MVTKEKLEAYQKTGRYIEPVELGNDDLGPLKNLAGTWINTRTEPNAPPTGFEGRGWNMISLPFITDPPPFDYRLLLNQYNERLKFFRLDGNVPNRGVDRAARTDTDQFVFAIDYEQAIAQIGAEDKPDSGLAGAPDAPIHHEPGFFLFMSNENTDNINIARMATIPHGDSVMALGRFDPSTDVFAGPPTIPPINGLPIGVPHDVDNNPYLRPYKDFAGDNAFKKDLFPGFPGFDPLIPHNLLNVGMPQNVKETTVLRLSTEIASGSVANIPFVVKQANAASMDSTFYIMELDENDETGKPKFLLAYTQVVMLDFHKRFDGIPGLIGWPHVSINMMMLDRSATNQESTEMPSS